MHITKININNCGVIKRFNWRINTSGNTVIICGLPGIGKSTILRTITYGLANLFMGKLVFVTYLLDNGDYNIKITLDSNTKDDSLFLQDNNTFSYPSYDYKIEQRKKVFGKRIPFAAIFQDTFKSHVGTNTAYSIGPFHCEEPGVIWIDPSNDSPKIDIRLLIARIVKHYISCGNYKEIISIIQQINSFLTDFFNIRIAINNHHVIFTRGAHSEVDKSLYISNAEEYVIGFLVTVYLCLNDNGILLLDSPEANVPPAILKQLIETAQNKLTQGQIIVATHSPSLLTLERQKSIYILKNSNQQHKAQQLNSMQNFKLMRKLYGEDVFNSLLMYIPTKQSSVILSYLLECFLSPSAITRKSGDPQIQQLALWLTGFFTSSNTKINLVDIGAGYGELVGAIKLSGCSDLVSYIPIELSKKYWPKIIARCKNNNISHEKPKQRLNKVVSKKKCLIFMINIMHELNLNERVKTLTEVFQVISDNGVLIIHEVAVLPVGESNFFVWSIDDIIDILNSTNSKFSFNFSKTVTRPGGWPLETLCIKLKGKGPSKNELLESIICNLPKVKARWEKKITSDISVSDLLANKYKAFLMAQLYNVTEWTNKYCNK